MKKDTERADEIRAMKKAWEDAEPGRAAKALQSRLQYLNTNMIKLSSDEAEPPKPAEGEEGVPPRDDGASTPQPSALDPFDSETNLTTEPPPPPPAKEMLQPLDLTPFIR